MSNQSVHPKDAAKILGLNGDITPEMVKKAYRAACSKYHPDRNPAGEEMMKYVNQAYDVLSDFSGNVDHQGDGYGDLLNDALNAVVNLPGLNIEVCGAWVWISGNTRDHKDALKEASYKWAPKKKMWYFRPTDYRSRGRGKWSMDQIRSEYGSTTVRSRGDNRLRAEA